MVSIPWQLKIFTKIVLSRLPLSYRFWNGIGIFKHGKMCDPVYALEVFKKHYDRVEFTNKDRNFVAMELGPGDSLYSAIIAHAHGASSVYLVDTDSYASHNMLKYQGLIQHLEDEGKLLGDVSSASSVKEMLKRCNAKYHTEGLASLRRMPSASVDFIWSQAVLEHIRRDEFLDTMRELRRVIRADGVCSHRIDLKDHLGGRLNNLRFSCGVWESDLFVNSGFYTNRLRDIQMIDIFEDVGFSVEKVNEDRWTSLPIERDKLSEEFASMPDDNLLVSGMDVILRPQ